MSIKLVQVLQLLAGLSFLIVLHEFGHFFFARLFKTRVEKFYLFFDFLFPVSNLLNFSLFKKKIGDTEYGIGWFPLGGYVKISGMVDESMDKEALAAPPQPWEFRSKKAYQRLLIMLGGIIMNVLIAIVLYMVIFGVWGESYIPMAKVTNGIYVNETGRNIGLRDGDKIRAIDGQPMNHLQDVPIALILHSKNAMIDITRNGKDTSLPIPFGTIRALIKGEGRRGVISVRSSAVVDSVKPISIAAQLGMRKGDSLVSVNDQPIAFNSDFIEYLPVNQGKPLAIAYVRSGKLDTLHTSVPKDSTLGAYIGSTEKFTEHVTYSPIPAAARGFSAAFTTLRLYIAQFKLLWSPEVKVNQSMGGFGTMAGMYSPVPTWFDFLQLTAFISIALAFMNLLPIPGLDGGYVIFLLFEMLTGKKVSEKVMETATTVGLVILLCFMVYANGLDILRGLGVKF